MRAEAVKCVRRVAVPGQGRVKGVAAVRVAGVDGRLAAKGVILRAGLAAAPLAAGVQANLANHIDVDPGPAQGDGVVAVVKRAGVKLAGPGQNFRGSVVVCQHKHLPGGDNAAQGDGCAGGGAAVKKELNIVTAGGQIHISLGAVENFQRLAVAGAFNVFREKQLGGRGQGP